MKSYILDTDICIYLIKNDSKRLLRRLRKIGPDRIFISSITAAELWYGVEKSNFREKNTLALLNFLAPFEILEFEDEAAFLYGEIRADLERQGKVIGSMDMLIAAQALKENIVIVTNNEREFKRVKGLSVENWAK